MSRILVACEESQAVTIELRKFGQEAYSCDIQECSGGHPEWHTQTDVLKILNGNCSFKTMDGIEHTINDEWDMIIAFPPCTHLAVSGAAHFAKKREDGRQREGIEFFMSILNADCDKIVVENPIGIISGNYIGKHFPELKEKYGLPIKPSQIIQPWMFGHPESKATCLWNKGVPLLKETNNVKLEMLELPKNKQQRLHYLPPSKNRAKLRSKTFPGIAKAMAEQWGGLL